ncbi:D-alanyl-D-alanine carboxypeptidase family protein [Alicyclobacillus shizuokensis]|uniref:D-alanyl-D-alanine carboxypeptidase family protein n=1 Tax=Alicyclobacillus shizuokensis TaxID=392014 RepID=UPI000836CD3F|nr:D-alanyl-D-alanine carboxypeptidase family protein [Alicyclobacillus shizuokensis]MCL6626915.1 D-alanyl-D-alanine carboxypeptidase [Alicyclobacillus shizuokensis]
MSFAGKRTFWGWLRCLTACLTTVAWTASVALAREEATQRVFINARAAVVLDAESGRVLYAKNADEPRYPASTTKLMTAILLVEYLHLNDPVYISEAAAHQPRVRLGLRPDTYITAEQALHALIMKSANDVAYAVAETVGGSQLGFARMMNVKARLLGCTHTNFVTPNGLHEDEHQASARDIALILREAVRHPEIVQAMQTQQYTIGDKTIRNGNRLIYLRDTPFGEVVGGKTGYTTKAMYCLAFAVRQHGRLRISVVLGAPRKSAMYRETQRLLGFAADNRAVQLV